jgi:transglutaminase-like putative cysteine protease
VSAGTGIAAPHAVAIPFLKERLLALGTLALLAPVPLFFSNALELAVLLVYLGVLGFFLLCVRRGRIPRLGNLVLNLAGLLYLPVIVLDARFGSHTLLKTMLHLLLFTTLFKIASIRKERDLSLALVLLVLLFVASVSTSFHYAILLYVILVAFVAWAVLVKWALWRDLAAAPEEWNRDRAVRELPGRGPLVTSVLSTVLLAVPFFLFLPRLKAPYVRGADAGREITTGFSENVDPDLFGALKQNDRVFLRITSEEPLGEGATAVLRLRTLALSRWEGGVWKKPMERGGRSVPAGRGSLIPLAPRGRGAGGGVAMTIDLTPIQTPYLPYPLLGNALRLSEGSFRNPGLAYVERDAARNVRLPFEPDRTIQYTALYGAREILDLEPGDAAEAGRAAGSSTLRAFALETLSGIDPAADPEAASRAIEAALQRWTYELDLQPRGPNAVEDFVANRRKGHCQTFATAMALLLREVGVPTRFVTGFLGGEIGAFGGYVLVRGQNVHAWVEAWCGPSRGWVTFDPTPKDGLPPLERVPVSQRLRQVTDGLEFAYDRFILSFGQGDQAEILRKIREATGGALDVLRRAGAAPVWRRGTAVGLWVAGGLLAVLFFVRRRARGTPWKTRGLAPASAAYRRLQKALHRLGAPLTPASVPAETLAVAVALGPHAARPAEAIIRAYVRESFGGLAAADGEEDRLRGLFKEFRVAALRLPAQ